MKKEKKNNKKYSEYNQREPEDLPKTGCDFQKIFFFLFLKRITHILSNMYLNAKICRRKIHWEWEKKYISCEFHRWRKKQQHSNQFNIQQQQHIVVVVFHSTKMNHFLSQKFINICACVCTKIPNNIHPWDGWIDGCDVIFNM